MKTILTSIIMAGVAVALAEAESFERYQTIIDRKPFGPEPANFDPEATPGTASATGAGGEDSGEMTPEQRSAEEQQLAASVRVSMLNVRPSGEVAVGFTDTSVNPPENYYLTVGRNQNGWTVKSADPATESVTLERNGVEVTMKLGETVGGKGGAARGAAQSARRPMLRPGDRSVAQEPAAQGAAGVPPHAQLGGLARLRMQRLEREKAEKEEKDRQREASAAAEQERKEREAREEEEKQRAAEERAQQREALLQIQEQLKKAREEREAAKRANQGQEGQQSEADDT